MQVILMAMKKEEALKILLQSAECYEKNLRGKNLLFIFENKDKDSEWYEAVFEGSNFLHLTGVVVDKSIISARMFYEQCLAKRLSTADFELSLDGTTELKLDVLPQLVSKNLSARMIGEFSSNRVKLYTERLAGNVYGCMGFVKDVYGRKNVPNTVLKQDIRDVTARANRILLTYRKEKEAAQYTEIVYSTKKYDWNKLQLPEEFMYLPRPQR
jgi:hypothetical protein